jgi:asparagine synthase (glutamine-hydrolysing)
VAQPLVRAAGANPKSAGMIELGGSYAGAYLLRRGLFMPWELGQLLPPDVVAEGLRRLAPLGLSASVLEPRPRSTHARVAALESSIYMRNQLLRDTDWASMAHSLEVRVPLVDRVLLSRLAWHTARLGRGAGKRLLSMAPRRPLPEVVCTRPKSGFATPMQVWTRPAPQACGSVPDCEAPAVATPQWARRWSLSIAGRAQATA